jgi:fatty acid amide hydrolase 2
VLVLVSSLSLGYIDGMSDTLFQYSTMETAELIRQKKVSARDVVKAHIDRLIIANKKINAVVQPLYEEALKAADKADRLTLSRKKNPLPILHGVPCTLKGNLAVNGKLWTGGNWYRKHVTADFDATVVKRVLAAGAIPLCLTNVPEACMWMETDNQIHGRTNNPHDLKRIVGGSSGGEAAVIAAGGAPFGVGSDVGGSIRMPSFFCGIAGHKPSGRSIPSTGQWPTVRGEALKYNCGGPMARRVSDLFPLFKILAGPDGLDKAILKYRLRDPDKVNLKKLKVYYYTENGQVAVSQTIKKAVLASARKMADMGCAVEEWRPKAFAQSLQIWGAMLSNHDARSYEQIISNGGAINVLRELMTIPFGQARHTFPSMALVLLERLFKVSPKHTAEFVKIGHQLRKEIEAKLGSNGVMLAPPYTHPAPKHHIPKFMPFNWVYTAIFNVMEMPVTAVPTGKTRNGLPYGVQVAAMCGRDELTLAVAQHLEVPISPVKMA